MSDSGTHLDRVASSASCNELRRVVAGTCELVSSRHLGRKIVEVIGRYSNPPGRDTDLGILLTATPVWQRDVRRMGPPKQQQHRLSPLEITQLCVDYRAGTKVRDLMARFGICRDTVFQHLRRHNVSLRFQPRLGLSEIAQAVEAYGDGRSLARIADQLDVSPETVRRALMKTGIPIRPRRGSPF
jgi:hypothetical protein